MTDVERIQVIAAEAMVEDFLGEGPLSASPETPCPYLPDRLATSEGFIVKGELSGPLHQAFINRGFRRSGKVIYRPRCAGCQLCIPIRVPIATFKPTRSMRRVWRHNSDIRVAAGPGHPTEAAHALYARYLVEQHDGTMSPAYEDFAAFLYGSPAPTEEWHYFAGQRLVGVSYLDRLPDGLSSVYMFFDPDEGQRSLGTYSVLAEIEDCRARGLAYYYLGYYVPGSRTMAYKARFRPAEILDASGEWQPLQDAELEHFQSDSC